MPRRKFLGWRNKRRSRFWGRERVMPWIRILESASRPGQQVWAFNSNRLMGYRSKLLPRSACWASYWPTFSSEEKCLFARSQWSTRSARRRRMTGTKRWFFNVPGDKVSWANCSMSDSWRRSLSGPMRAQSKHPQCWSSSGWENHQQPQGLISAHNITLCVGAEWQRYNTSTALAQSSTTTSISVL